MHDAIQFERLRIPATLLITEPFQGLAASFGVTLGAPAYPSVMVPHPISSKSPEYIREVAERVAPDVAARLTTG